MLTRLKNIVLRWYMLPVLLMVVNSTNFGQPIPSVEENIPFLVTFGKDGSTSWGDDDFCQILFCFIPEDVVSPVFIRVFDPETGGLYDEAKGVFDTEISFSVYAGQSCWSHKDAQNIEPTGNYKSGIKLVERTFKTDNGADNKWVTLGPFNPTEAEYVEKFGGRVFKVIIEGISGNDGNLYRLFLSSSPSKNIPIEGGNIFTYEYTFRLVNDNNQVSQIYPFIDDKTISIKISTFDWDNDGFIKIISVAKNGVTSKISGENNWYTEEFEIVEEEKNTSIEVQFVKNKEALIKNNNVSITVKNQYGISLPFYLIPIGGIPVYNPKINLIGVD